LTIRVTKALSAGAEKTGDPEKTEGNLPEGSISSGRGSFAKKTILGLVLFAVSLSFPSVGCCGVGIPACPALSRDWGRKAGAVNDFF